jgi:hypothetical protein
VGVGVDVVQTRCVGVLVCWCVGVLVCWCVGVLVCWCVGVLVCWCVGVLVCIYVGGVGLGGISMCISPPPDQVEACSLCFLSSCKYHEMTSRAFLLTHRSPRRTRGRFSTTRVEDDENVDDDFDVGCFGSVSYTSGDGVGVSKKQISVYLTVKQATRVARRFTTCTRQVTMLQKYFWRFQSPNLLKNTGIVHTLNLPLVVFST